jgi:photosystem II stability/assembly factor-like uncharacterized protein
MKLVFATLSAGVLAAPEWSIINKGFSAVTIGIGFQDDKTGWTSFTDGASAPALVKTTDGGATWNAVQSQAGNRVMPMSVAAKKGADTDVATVGLVSGAYTTDGDNFLKSTGAPFDSQDAKIGGDGKVWVAGDNGPCVSTDGGATYSCTTVPLANPGTGRYVSSPVENVIYFTAGNWPASQDPSQRTWTEGAEKHHQLTRVLKTVTHSETGAIRYEITTDFGAPNDDTVYNAELWKSTDNGATWKSLLSATGDFYFNDIHCIDEIHCVAVAEGFAQDGSTAPGARVYLTQDGETFNEVHRENTTGMESLMTARMISTTEHWVGGTTKSGALFAPALALHSKDAGQTHNNEAESIQGNMFTSLDFISAEHGYATALTGAQVCNILEFGGTNPPAPSPTPTPGGHHYAKPPCQDDEAMAKVTGTDGACCAPVCQDNACPTDLPDGVTAQPACALSDSSGNKFCALLCDSDDQCDSDGGASCAQPTAGQPGLCLYPAAANGIPMFMEPTVLV